MDSDADGQKILHWAAATGSKDTFETVLAALSDRLRNGQVRHPIKVTGVTRPHPVLSARYGRLPSTMSSLVRALRSLPCREYMTSALLVFGAVVHQFVSH